MKLHRLTTQLVAGAILTLPLWVNAAGLGKLTVKSALGQPLSAEIELLVADKTELDSLNAALASGQAFKDAQIEYAPVLSTLQFTVVASGGGNPVLKLTSSKPVNDPFMDMLVELNWASGRLLREYTILLDPPGVAVPQTVSPVAVSIPDVKPMAAPAQAAPKPAANGAPVSSIAPVGEKAAPKTAEPKPAAAPAAEAKAAPMADYVQVRRGDTLAKIANQVRPANVSLEQALVALFHENSAAFAGKNMNRLKAGQKLKLPSAESMAALDKKSAAREINLQAADWQAYRAKLAESVAAQPEKGKEAASRTLVGKVTPKVEDKAQPKADEAKDVLKLSRAATQAAAAAPGAAATAKAQAEQKAAQAKAQAEAEDKAAREKALKESAERAASLEKQIQDMQKLVELKEKETAGATADKGAEKPPVAAAPKVKAKAPIAIEEPEPSWIDEVVQNPIYWVAGGGVVVLGGLLWWMMAGGRLRKKARSATDNFMTVTDMQPSVVESATTGGVVNTGDTSFLTDFSQAGLAEIDTHDVDPIAEADVYMAYGRDAQAEEILKEALTKSPDRHEIRLKLLEIYAARKNIAAFEEVAGQLYAVLGGQPGQIWDKAVEMGRAIDPRNPLYGSAAHAEEEPNTIFSPAAPEPAAPVKTVAEPVKAPAPAAVEPVLNFTSEPPAMEMDLDFSALEKEAKAEEAKVEAAVPAESNELDFDLSGFELNLPEAAPSTAPMPSTAQSMDFSGLDLNLNDMGGDDAFDEVSTKLDLARAYLEMGDKEGAREILEEVVSEGNAKQKSDAEGIMATL